jgi:hypothetical protein
MTHRRNKIIKLLTIAITATMIIIPHQAAQAYPAADQFPRTMVPYMKLIEAKDYDALAKFDVITLPAELQEEEPQVFQELRKRNPKIILLAYFPTKSYITGWGDSLHVAEKRGIDPSWYLKDASGNTLSVWPGTQALSITSGWNSYAPQFVHDHILSTGLWDGIFYDEVSDTISWLNSGNVDLNHDGAPDNGTVADAAWKAGMITMLQKARSLDPDKIFVINGTSTPEFQQYVNGRMFETFPSPWEANGDWYELMRRYIANEPLDAKPEVIIINANTANSGNQGDYSQMRFGLTSALMGNAFYSFDYGDQDHGQTWRYDEYSISLGKPTGAPTLATNSAVQATAANGYRFSAGVWQRDYTNGVVFVNPTATAQTVTFDSEYEKIHGSQDPATNDGSIVSAVTIQPKDGLVMLRPLDHVTGAPYLNGSFIRVLNVDGSANRTGFFAYDSRYKGSSTVVSLSSQTVVADKTNVTVYDAAGNMTTSFAPFGATWKNGMSLAVGDINGDGQKEIIVGAGAGGAPLVKIFDLHGNLQKSWNAYVPAFKGGVNVAVGNVLGNGWQYIVTGPGAGGGPHVRVFDANGIVKQQFFAYANSFTGGVYVAAGDTLGLGRDQIITGAGFGGGPQIRVFDGGAKDKTVGSFFAYKTTSRAGVRVSASDLTGSGRASILAESTDVFAASTLGAPSVRTKNQEPISRPGINTNNQAPISSPGQTDIPDHPLFLGTYITER